MTVKQKLDGILAHNSFTGTGYISVARLHVYPEVRAICKGNTCRGYGTSWACPPAVGTVEECAARVNQFDTMLLLSKKYQLEDSFDFEAMTEGFRDFKVTVDDFHQKIKEIMSDYILLSNEGCGRCSKCTYPDAPCRFPELLCHSLEGYGFLVNELAAQAGIPYNNGVNTVTFYGALIFNQEN